jgi:hypothetical protein
MKRPGTPPGRCFRGIMPRLRVFRVVLAAALLSVCAAAAAHAAPGEAATQADLVSPSSHISGVPLPAHGVVPAAPPRQLELRGVRPATTVHGRGHRPRSAYGCRAAPRGPPREPRAGYAVARLLRGGIHSSSLGTPPPRS